MDSNTGRGAEDVDKDGKRDVRDGEKDAANGDREVKAGDDSREGDDN